MLLALKYIRRFAAISFYILTLFQRVLIIFTGNTLTRNASINMLIHLNRLEYRLRKSAKISEND